MRRLISIALALALTALLGTQSAAAASAEIIRAFVYEGTLYTYVSMADLEEPVTKAEAKLGGQSFAASGRLETVRQAGSPVTWLLLVDASTSMPAFRQEAEDLAESLAQSAGENTRFILATFGDAFQIVDEDVPAGELAGTLAAVPFDERVTRLHTGIDQALDYFEGLPRARSELRCMVILSDAVQYDPAGGVPYETLLERVSRSDVMLHSVGLGSDTASLDSLGRLSEASGGLHQVVGGVSAGEAGTALVEFGNELFVTGFALNGYTSEGGTETVSVTFAAGSTLLCRTETEVELPELTGELPPVQPDAPGTSDMPGTPGVPPSVPDAPAAPDTPSAPEAGGLPLPVLLGAGGAMAVTLLLVVTVLLLGRRKKKKRAAPPPADAAAPVQQPAPVPEGPAGVYISVELASGEKQALTLQDTLTIGSAPVCDIQLSTADQRHARLLLQDGAVWLEDLCSQEGTRVNGEAVTAPRRLRSGDEITAGKSAIRLRF